MKQQPIIQVNNLRKLFPVKKATIWDKEDLFVHAVDDVSFDLHYGEVLALVGESGCGKSTLALTLMNLERPTEGQIFFEGRDVTHLDGKALQMMRRDIQMVFQDPYESLNPTMTIGPAICCCPWPTASSVSAPACSSLASAGRFRMRCLRR
jgi:ABC-type oligopeptide transport system ATPase subunit